MPTCGKIPPWLRIHHPSVAIAMTSLGAGLIHGVLMFYYVKVFMNKYHISNAWFSVVQIVYMIWNAVNDPLFGYLQDFGCGGVKWIQNRKKVVLYCALPFALSFMLFWIPWYPTGDICNEKQNQTTSPTSVIVPPALNFSSGAISNRSSISACPIVYSDTPEWLIGLHLLVSLFLYDTMFSLALSAHCGLFTEMTTTPEGRVRIVKYMAVANMISTFVIFPVDNLSNSLQNYTNFQIVCAVVAFLAMLCFVYTGILSPEPEPEYQNNKAVQMNSVEPAQQRNMVVSNGPGACVSPVVVCAVGPDESSKAEPSDESCMHGLKRRLKSTKEIVCNRDFASVVAGNFIHILRQIGTANFMAIYTEALVPRDVLPLGSVAISAFYTACNTLPKLVILLVSPLLVRFGAWTCLQTSLLLSVVNCLICYFIGPYSGALITFILIDNILGDAFWQMYNILFPDIVHEDFEKYNRSNPLTTLIFTLNALFTKPAISLGPIFIAQILHTGAYEAYKHDQNSLTLDERSHLNSLMFHTLCFYPLILACLEALVLIPYRMKFAENQWNWIAAIKRKTSKSLKKSQRN